MPALLWFDDSLLNTYEIAWPILETYNYTGTISVITGYVGNTWLGGIYRDKPQMSIRQLKEMKNNGWDLQNHGVLHPDFFKLAAKDVEWELMESKRWMLENLNISPRCFVLPYGRAPHHNLILKYYNYVRTTQWGFWDGKNNTIPIIRNLNVLKFLRDPRIFSVFLFHSIIDNPENGEITRGDFQLILDKIHISDVELVTFSEAINKKNEINYKSLIKYYIMNIPFNIIELLKRRVFLTKKYM